MSCHDKKKSYKTKCANLLNTNTKLIKLENVCRALKELQKSLNLGPLVRKQGLEKIHSFPEFGMTSKNNYNSNLKNLLGFRNMLEKLENYFL